MRITPASTTRTGLTNSTQCSRVLYTTRSPANRCRSTYPTAPAYDGVRSYIPTFLNGASARDVGM